MTEFEKIFHENREFIFRYLMKMTRDAALAEELTQETFFRAYMNYTLCLAAQQREGICLALPNCEKHLFRVV